MSRYTKAAPGGRPTVLEDGYHLCARCGTILCTDDGVVVVYRAPWWGVYVHPQGPDCPAKAVSGWRAAELALDMRESNVPTPREACRVNIGGFTLPFVSLLDNEHCNVETAAVTISQKDFLPINPSADVADEGFLPDLIGNWGDHCHWREWWYKELKIVEALDQGIYGAFVRLVRDVLNQERAFLYVNRSGPWTTTRLSERDERPKRTTVSPPASSSLPRRKSKSSVHQRKSRQHHRRSSGGLGHSLTRDVTGRFGEDALYSQRKLTDGNRVLRFGKITPLDEFRYWLLSGPKPQPSSLPFDSLRCPEMFDWSHDGVPKELVEHWSNNPKTSPYGPVARLKPGFLAALRKSE